MFPVWQNPFYSVGQVYFVALPLFVSSVPTHHRTNAMNEINSWKPSKKVLWAAKKTHQKVLGKEECICLQKATAAKSGLLPQSQVTASKRNCPGVVRKCLIPLLQPPLPPVQHPNYPLPRRSKVKPRADSQSSSPTYGAALTSSGQQIKYVSTCSAGDGVPYDS